METTGQVTRAVFLWEGCYYHGIGQAKRSSHSAISRWINHSGDPGSIQPPRPVLLTIKLKSQRGEPASTDATGAFLALHDYKSPTELEEERKRELAVQEEKRRLFEADKLVRLEQEARLLEKAQTEIPAKLILAQEKLQITPFPTVG